MLREYISLGPSYNQSIGVNYVIHREGSLPEDIGAAVAMKANSVLFLHNQLPLDGGRLTEEPTTGLSHGMRRQPTVAMG